MILLGSGLGQIAYRWASNGPATDLGTAFGIGLLSSLLYVLSARSAGLYSLPALLHPTRQVSKAVTVCAFVFLSLAAVLLLLKVGSEFSRGAMLSFAAAALTLCVMTRIGAAGVIDGLMQRDAIAGRPAFLIGETGELAALSPAFLLRHFGVREAGRLALDTNDVGDLQSLIDDALAEARSKKVKEFLVATSWERSGKLGQIEEALRLSPLPVRLMPTRESRAIIELNASALANYTVELQREPMSATERVVKRAVDITLSLVAIVVFMPVLILTACAVKLDSPGPVIFRQRRNGFDQRQFVIFKFRTMRVLEDGSAIQQARRNDTRITTIGRVLRRTSIDELPQLFNVLRGEMSLVGPRPHALAHDREYTALIGDYCLRHHVKPGITGLAQIKGCRGETARPEHMQQRVEYDLRYIKNWSVLLDLSILARTALNIVSHDAY